MIQSFLDTLTLLPSNTAPVSFERDCIKTRSANPCGGWLCHNEGSPLYKIMKGGNYRVTFNANVSGATAGTPVALALFMDGVELPGTRVIQNVETAGAYYNVAFNKVVPICCCGDGTLTIQSVPSILTGTTIPGAPTTTETPLIQNANLTITKVC